MYDSTLWVNVCIHTTIALLTVSIIFWILGVPADDRATKRNLNNVSKDIIDDINTNGDDKLKAFLKKINYDGLISYYDKTDSDKLIQDKWLLNTTYAMIVGMIILCIVVVTIFNTTCKQKIDWNKIIVTNLVLLVIIGCFEFVFFKQVASQYIPVLPSQAIHTLSDNLKL